MPGTTATSERQAAMIARALVRRPAPWSMQSSSWAGCAARRTGGARRRSDSPLSWRRLPRFWCSWYGDNWPEVAVGKSAAGPPQPFGGVASNRYAFASAAHDFCVVDAAQRGGGVQPARACSVTDPFEALVLRPRADRADQRPGLLAVTDLGGCEPEPTQRAFRAVGRRQLLDGRRRVSIVACRTVNGACVRRYSVAVRWSGGAHDHQAQAVEVVDGHGDGPTRAVAELVGVSADVVVGEDTAWPDGPDVRVWAGVLRPGVGAGQEAHQIVQVALLVGGLPVVGVCHGGTVRREPSRTLLDRTPTNRGRQHGNTRTRAAAQLATPSVRSTGPPPPPPAHPLATRVLRSRSSGRRGAISGDSRRELGRSASQDTPRMCSCRRDAEHVEYSGPTARFAAGADIQAPLDSA
jgi:hypothetical protein